MTSKSFLAFTLTISTHLFPVWAAPNIYLEPRAGVCNGGVYGELAPILAGYSIAQAFCSAVYPVTCTTVAQNTKRSSAQVSCAKPIREGRGGLNYGSVLLPPLQLLRSHRPH